ncbi:MAG: hypothetical protein ABFD16_07180 [Thermoguttaceae bacterium]|jgi:hypothetical protein
MLSLPTAVALEVASTPVADSPESQNLSGSSVPADTALMAPPPKTSFTLIGPALQPTANTNLTDPLPNVDPALVDAALAMTGQADAEADAVDSIVLFGEDAETNQPPTITSFWCFENVGTWTICGAVSDPDDSLVGRTVTFGGVLESYHLSAEVDANNNFSINETLEGLQTGIATATITDPHGASGSYVTYVSPS